MSAFSFVQMREVEGVDIVGPMSDGQRYVRAELVEFVYRGGRVLPLTNRPLVRSDFVLLLKPERQCLRPEWIFIFFFTIIGLFWCVIFDLSLEMKRRMDTLEMVVRELARL